MQFGKGDRSHRTIRAKASGLSNRRPLHLCPVCLRKLQWSIGFDVVKRYEALRQFYRVAGFADEEKWACQRLDKLKAKGGG